MTIAAILGAKGTHVAGQAEQALAVVTEALEAAERCGERFYARVHECFQIALAVARRQGARALERRILTGLGTSLG